MFPEERKERDQIKEHDFFSVTYLSCHLGVDYISCLDILLVFRKEKLHIAPTCCLREHNAQLPMREDRDLEVNSDMLDRLTLWFVYCGSLC